MKPLKLFTSPTCLDWGFDLQELGFGLDETGRQIDLVVRPGRERAFVGDAGAGQHHLALAPVQKVAALQSRLKLAE